nr:hypothetical protein [Tanacetum cinerariifolium]
MGQGSRVNVGEWMGSSLLLEKGQKEEKDVVFGFGREHCTLHSVLNEDGDRVGWSISITFRFSVRLQTPDDPSRSWLGFTEKMGVHG